jgi:SAM-dependent methyltransferase
MTLQREVEARPAFDLVHGFAITNVFASLEMAGVLDDLGAEGVRPGRPHSHGPDADALLEASLRYLERRGLVEEDGGVFRLSELGRVVARDRGYLVWAAGGYGEPLHHLDAFILGSQRYGTDHPRDGRWVAGGAALLGRQDVVPHAMKLLERVSFDRALDLGCGNARFLLAVCQRFGAGGAGIDLSPEACEEAVKAVRAAGMTDRVQIVEGDAFDVDRMPSVAETQLVITFFLLHEISSVSRAALVDFLSRLSARLPAGAHLLTAEVVPPEGDGATAQRFTPEFDFVHAMMRQSLMSADAWREALKDGGFEVQEMLDVDMPGGLLILARTAV